MLILAVDSSGKTAGVALVSEEKVIAETSLNCGYTHSQTLMPLVDHVVRMSGITLSDIDYIACASGPGSFTGLRIGAGCAKGLAAGLCKKMVNVSVLDALAYNVYRDEGLVVPIMDARRGEVYAAIYNGYSRVSDYIADKIETVIDMVKKTGNKAVFLGDGVPVHRELLLKEGMEITPVGNNLQRAASVGILAFNKIQAGEICNPGDFKIFYIRKPQAERELCAK
jgi:tRNA threonylcarbamoyladenosine biosynthesis protein TsaB